VLKVEELRSSRAFIVFLAGLVALAPFAIDAYLPSLPAIATEFGEELNRVSITITFYLIGAAIGQFFGGSISDHVGRKPVALTGLALFAGSSLAISFTPGIDWMYALRACQALGGGFASVTCLAQLRDVSSPDEVARRFAMVTSVMLAAPMVAPTVGALLLSMSWRAVFYFLAVYSLLLFSVYVFLIPETRSGERTNISMNSLFAGYRQVVSHRDASGRLVIRYALFVAFNGGVFMSFLTNSSAIYMDSFSMSSFLFALTFGAHGFALLIGTLLSISLARWLKPVSILKTGNSLQIVTLISGAAITWLHGLNIYIVLATTLFAIGLNGAMNPVCSGEFIRHYRETSGSAASLNSTMMFMIGSLIGGFAALLSGGDILVILLFMAGSAIVGRTTL